MALQIINPIDYPGWDDLLLSHPGYSFFHSSAWARVLFESYRYTPKYFSIIDEGKLLALIPVMEVNSFLTGRRGVSLPFTDYCEPIYNGNIGFVHLLNQVIEFGRKHGWKYIELRVGYSLNANSFSLLSTVNSFNQQPATSNGFSLTRNLQPETSNIIPSLTFLGHVLDLSRSQGEVFSKFRDSTKRNAKKAMKEGVKVKIEHCLESMNEFYRLNCLTRKEHGLPPQPFNFFKEIYDHVISKNLGMVVLASLGQENVAGAIYFHFGKKAVYKYGASDKKFQHLRANNLIMWEAIKWYSQNGYKSLCFGRTEPENQGLIQFKSGWGTTEQPIHYYQYDLKKGSFVRSSSKVTGFHNKIFRNIPIPISNLIGSVLYKHVG
jgi:hypothetical protein